MNLFRRGFLQDVTAGSCFDRGQDVGLRVVGGQDQDRRRIFQQFDPRCGRDAVHSGAHLQVHEHNIDPLTPNL